MNNDYIKNPHICPKCQVQATKTGTSDWICYRCYSLWHVSPYLNYFSEGSEWDHIPDMCTDFDAFVDSAEG